MGARADGWWRDRSAAALRLYREIAALAARGVEPGVLPDGVEPGVLPDAVRPATRPARCFPEYVLVLEGRSRDAAAQMAAAPGPRVRVVAAPGAGDDAIAEVAHDLPGPRLVVTADRELRRRVAAAGAAVTGPGWLLGLL